MNLRNTNGGCFTCVKQFPAGAEAEWDRDYVQYVCPNCGDVLLHGLVAENGPPVAYPRDAPLHPEVRNSTLFPSELSLGTVEAYWINHFAVFYIHGKRINATDGLGEYVDHILSLVNNG